MKDKRKRTRKMTRGGDRRRMRREGEDGMDIDGDGGGEEDAAAPS